MFRAKCEGFLICPMEVGTPFMEATGMVKLIDVNRENYRKIIGLKVGDGQTAFVDTNAFYLAQASYENDCYPFGIY